jgi:hypothetical protein
MKLTEDFSQNSRDPDRDLKPRSVEYQACHHSTATFSIIIQAEKYEEQAEVNPVQPGPPQDSLSWFRALLGSVIISLFFPDFHVFEMGPPLRREEGSDYYR